ncbi:uncharacterized protein LOC132696706 isoform X2 [Cylas formicarius]|uniref:uncharacterized protein LOC132696706 isoform X2 n=1 Tax=Cylas formicarius TaxID=197179 RepID=UPI002958A111|nr:uncharacterized protein LOC132696706 isoform X2 [Cylas formicarius]
MAYFDVRIFAIYFAAATFCGLTESRAVNITNTWMLPEEGFPVFYRYFRDRISWYEADAVCQFHHANLVTADTSSQYDAIRAYLKELDIRDKVWIGLSMTREKPNFTWSDYRPLTGEGHWQEALPAGGQGDSLCAIMDPAADFLWRPLPCGGPEIAAFICELEIPTWAVGPKGCLLTELPSLTALYIPEQTAVELTSDCGLDGTKRIACKGNADREELLKQLACVIPNEDFEDKSTRSSAPSSSVADDYETTTVVDGNSLNDKTTKSWIWTSNTVDVDYGMPTRHRRETEDTLSPVSTRSSFNQAPTTTDLSWKLSRHQEAVLTTPQSGPELRKAAASPTAAPNYSDPVSPGVSVGISTIQKGISSDKSTAAESTVTSTTDKGYDVEAAATTERTTDSSTGAPKDTGPPRQMRTTQVSNTEEYPSAINQGQLFGIIENGTMFDIIELNDTAEDGRVEPKSTEEPQTGTTPTPSEIHPAKKYDTKDPPPTKKPVGKEPSKKPNSPKSKTRKEPETDLNKEYELLPEIKDTSTTLNRTYRKEVPLLEGESFRTPKIINFSVNNNINGELEDNLEISFREENKNTNITETIILSALKSEDGESFEPNIASILENIESGSREPPMIDPKIDELNRNAPKNNDSEPVPIKR